MPALTGILLRTLTGVVLVVVVLALIWIPLLSPIFTLFVAAMAAIGLHEFYRFAKGVGVVAEARVGGVLGAIVVLAAFWGNHLLVIMLLFAAVAIITAVHIFRGNHALNALNASVFGLIYVAWMAAYFVLLHRIPLAGPGLLTVLIIAVAISDTGAYFTGKNLGRNKLAPKVSPKKTIEGAIGGLVFAGLALALLGFLEARQHWGIFPDWPLWRYVLTGVLLSAVGQIGDLAESMMKRDAGIKDSGDIFPGHGGVLDRCDGFLFTAPLLYFSVVF